MWHLLSFPGNSELSRQSVSQFLSQCIAETTIPLALENDVGIILGSPLGGSLLAGPEPIIKEELIHDEDGIPIPAVAGSLTDPAVFPRAHEMWQWCRERSLNIRDLAMQFVLSAPVEGNGIVLSGPASQREFEEVYASATTEVPEAVSQEFEAEFGVRI